MVLRATTRSTASSSAPLTAAGVPLTKPIVTSSGSSGAFSGADFDFTRYSGEVAASWFGRKLRRLGTVAQLFYGRGSNLGFALASRSRRLQDVGIRWYNGVGDWDRISGWRALGRVLRNAV